MDPNQTLKDLADAYERDDREGTLSAAQSMLIWLRKGGFPPRITGHFTFDRMMTLLICDDLLEEP